jgi:hypothetical protein
MLVVLSGIAVVAVSVVYVCTVADDVGGVVEGVRVVVASIVVVL